MSRVLLAVVAGSFSVLVRLTPPDVTIYVEPKVTVADAERFVQTVACPLLKADGVPTPVPYRLVWFQAAREGAAQTPGPHDVRGVLWSCP